MAEEEFPSKKDWYAQNPKGTTHKLAQETQRLTEKYAAQGKDFTKTNQYRVLQDYLDGVPAVRGGNLGRRDDTFGGHELFGGYTMDTSSPEFQAAQDYRIGALNKMVGIGSLDNAQRRSMMNLDDRVDYLKSLDADQLRTGLNPKQYFNLRQQMYNADILGYRTAWPWASGAVLEALATKGLGAISFPAKIGMEALKSIGGQTKDLVEYGYIGDTDVSPMIETAVKPIDWLAEGIENLRLQLTE
jgi:hypothetical protein